MSLVVVTAIQCDFNPVIVSGFYLFDRTLERAVRALVLSMSLLLAACGQRGPLYLPDEQPATPVAPASPAEPAAGAGAAAPTEPGGESAEDEDEEDEEDDDGSGEG